MTIRILALTATLAFGATTAQAATIFTNAADYNAALGGAVTSSEGFGNAAGERILTEQTVFASGITLDLSPTFTGQSADTSVRDGVLRLSIDNSGSPTNTPSPLVTTAKLTLPELATAFAFEFGFPNANNSGFGRGVGNDSGTSLLLDQLDFDFTTGTGTGFTFAPNNSFDSGGTDGVGYTGFFGVIGAPGETYEAITFSSNGLGTDTDDDFTVRNISFAPSVAPVPVPASLPLLAVSIGAFVALRHRRRRD